MRVDFSIEGDGKDISVFMDTFFGLVKGNIAAYPVVEDSLDEMPEDKDLRALEDAPDDGIDEGCGDCPYIDTCRYGFKEEAAKPKELTTKDIYNRICSAVTASLGCIIRSQIHIPEKMDSKTFELVDNIIDAYSMSAAMLITEAVRNENRK